MEQSQSPLPKEAEVEKVEVIGLMGFPEAIGEVIKGNKITRKEWEDEDSYGVMQDGFLMIKNKGMHQWLVAEEDMIATDWIVIK